MTSGRRALASRTASSVHANRVAEPTAVFWVVKVLTTGMGETISDHLVKTFPPEAVVPAAFAALAAVLTAQLRARRYRPARYWTTALMVSVFGTMVADVLHVGLGVPYAASTAGFAVLLAGVFGCWWASERTLSVHGITTARRERFYWAAVMGTFALGTAAGDLTANGLGLGYLASGVGFAVLFALPGLVRAVTRRAAVAVFWSAYVLTRPLGASFADWIAAPAGRGGLAVGTGPVSLLLLAAFALLVGGLELAARRERAPATAPHRPSPVEGGSAADRGPGSDQGDTQQ